MLTKIRVFDATAKMVLLYDSVIWYITKERHKLDNLGMKLLGNQRTIKGETDKSGRNSLYRTYNCCN